MHTSRVPLALAGQRFLAATDRWYDLNVNARSRGGGFVYKRKQNSDGEEVKGIVPPEGGACGITRTSLSSGAPSSRRLAR